MDHLHRFCLFKNRTGNRRLWNFQKIRRPVPCIHILGEYPPHVSALSAEYPLYAETLGLCIYLGIEPLRHFVRGEKAEVSSFGSISAPGIVEPKFLKQHKVSHARIRTGVRKQIARWCYEQNLGTLAVEGRLDSLARDGLYIIQHIF